MTEWMNAEGFVRLIWAFIIASSVLSSACAVLGRQLGTVERPSHLASDNLYAHAGTAYPSRLCVLICEMG